MKKNSKISNNVTIIAEGITFEGKLTSQGSVIIYGKVEGEIISKGRIVIGKTGIVKADIVTGSLEIAGKVKGAIKARDEVVINSSGILKGNIIQEENRIIIRRGGCFMGKSINRESEENSLQDYGQALEGITA